MLVPVYTCGQPKLTQPFTLMELMTVVGKLLENKKNEEYLLTFVLYGAPGRSRNSDRLIGNGT